MWFYTKKYNKLINNTKKLIFLKFKLIHRRQQDFKVLQKYTLKEDNSNFAPCRSATQLASGYKTVLLNFFVKFVKIFIDSKFSMLSLRRWSQGSVDVEWDTESGKKGTRYILVAVKWNRLTVAYFFVGITTGPWKPIASYSRCLTNEFAIDYFRNANLWLCYSAALRQTMDVNN